MPPSQSDGQQSASDDGNAVQAANGKNLCIIQSYDQKEITGISEQPFHPDSQPQRTDSYVLYRTGSISYRGQKRHDQRAEKSGNRRDSHQKRKKYLSAEVTGFSHVWNIQFTRTFI